MVQVIGQRLSDPYQHDFAEILRDASQRGLANTAVMRKVIRRPRHCAEAVISTLVNAVVSRLTDHHTIIEMIRATKLYVFDVMSLSTLPKPVLGAARFTNLHNRRSARCTEILLPEQR